MTLDYQKVWNALNELESVTTKVCSAREILESAIDALENHKYAKTEALMYAANEFLEYYLNDFDEKFKDAWKETVVKIKQEEHSYLTNDFLTQDRISNFPGEQDVINFCDNNDTSSECQSSWNDFWENNNYPYGISSGYDYDTISFNLPTKEDKVVKWRLPVEFDDASEEYFVQFPDDLLESANLKEGDEVYWQDNNNGTFTLRKVTKPLGMDEC
jgi:hypothetical protein